jgi:hypothetical protein
VGSWPCCYLSPAWQLVVLVGWRCDRGFDCHAVDAVLYASHRGRSKTGADRAVDPGYSRWQTKMTVLFQSVTLKNFGSRHRPCRALPRGGNWNARIGTGLPGNVLPARKNGPPLGGPGRIWMSRYGTLSSARAVSTDVRLDIPVASGEVRVKEIKRP